MTCSGACVCSEGLGSDTRVSEAGATPGQNPELETQLSFRISNTVNVFSHRAAGGTGRVPCVSPERTGTACSTFLLDFSSSSFFPLLIPLCLLGRTNRNCQCDGLSPVRACGGSGDRAHPCCEAGCSAFSSSFHFSVSWPHST